MNSDIIVVLIVFMMILLTIYRGSRPLNRDDD
jgi:hypothetical protein